MPRGFGLTKMRTTAIPGGNSYSQASLRNKPSLTWNNNYVSWGPTNYAYPTWQGTQITESENHPEWRRRSPGLSDIGGNFYSSRKYVEVRPQVQHFSGRYEDSVREVTWKHVGPVLPLPPGSMTFPSNSSSSDSSLDGWGAKAIAICKPTNPSVNLGQALGELYREGIPKFLGADAFSDQAMSAARKGGSEFLNLEFGWKPLLNDARKFVSAVQRADAVMKQYKRDAGRVVRRRFEFPIVHTTDSVVTNNNVSAFIFGPTWTGLYDSVDVNKGRVVRTTETSIRRWFSGAFTYHMPDSDVMLGMSDMVKSYQHHFGLELTPELIWKLTPWSWAPDWFSSLGAVISNWQSAQSDGLVMKYGYIMEHSFTRVTYTFVGPTGFTNKAVRPSNVVLVNETKLRKKANPYGFGLTWDGLSPRQLAILGALGITRGK